MQPPAGSPSPDLVLRGGGSTFWFSASFPFLRLTADHEGISVSTAGRVGRMLVGAMLPPGPARDSDGPVWASSWSDLDRAIAAQRSVVMWRRGGEFCRFVTLRQRQLRPLLDLLASQEVKLDHVRGTVLLGTFRKSDPA